jgi:carbon-monoxide dehydrogenase iron sulfur subunit
MAKMIAVSIEKCMACKACEFACAVEHSTTKDPESIVKDGEKPGYRINVEAYGRNAIPINCNHCEEAACIMACPTGAIYRNSEKGPVLFKSEKCIGCKMCVQACPFGVITVSPDGKGVLKCDLCIERLAKGEQVACVTACPTSALRFIDDEEANKEKRQKVAARLVAAQQASTDEPEE